MQDKINHHFCYTPLPLHPFFFFFFPSRVCLLYISPWNPTLKIFLNLVASFADLILMSHFEWPTIVLKFVFVLCRLQTDKNSAFFSFCEASCHSPGLKRQNVILWITRGGLQALLLFRDIFPPVLPLCSENSLYEGHFPLFSCDRSHGFFSSHN